MSTTAENTTALIIRANAAKNTATPTGERVLSCIAAKARAYAIAAERMQHALANDGFTALTARDLADTEHGYRVAQEVMAAFDHGDDTLRHLITASLVGAAEHGSARTAAWADFAVAVRLSGHLLGV